MGLRADDRAEVPLPASPDAMNRFFVGRDLPDILHNLRPTVLISLDKRSYFRHITVEETSSALDSARSEAIGPDGIQL